MDGPEAANFLKVDRIDRPGAVCEDRAVVFYRTGNIEYRGCGGLARRVPT